MNSNEPFLFLKSFLQNPKHVGSVMPSSRFLANQRVNQASWPEAKAVAELGSGTGAITRYIHQNTQESTTVLLFEMNETMRTKLRTTYPQFTCYPDASRLFESMKLEGIQQLDYIFSGLPFLILNQK